MLEKLDSRQPSNTRAHFAPRGRALDISDNGISGYEHHLMGARVLLSQEEEKKLLRRVDLRLMPLCALILLVKNIDANNVRPSLRGAQANGRQRMRAS